MDNWEQIIHPNYRREKEEIMITHEERTAPVKNEPVQRYSEICEAHNGKSQEEELIAELRPRIEDTYNAKQTQFKKEYQKRLKEFKTQFNQSVKLDADAQIQEILKIRRKELNKYYKDKLKTDAVSLEQEFKMKFNQKLEIRREQAQAELEVIRKTKELIEAQLSELNINKKMSVSRYNPPSSQSDESSEESQDTPEVVSPEPQTCTLDSFYNESFRHEEDSFTLIENSIDSSMLGSR